MKFSEKESPEMPTVSEMWSDISLPEPSIILRTGVDEIDNALSRFRTIFDELDMDIETEREFSQLKNDMVINGDYRAVARDARDNISAFSKISEPTTGENIARLIDGLFLAGSVISIENTNKRISRLAKKYNIEDAESVLSTLSIESSAAAKIEINGIKLEDFLDHKKIKNQTPDFINFLAEAYKLADLQRFIKFKDELMKEHPFSIHERLTERRCEDLVNITSSLLGASEALLGERINTEQGLERDVLKVSEDLLKGRTFLQETTQKVMLNPKHPQFEKMTAILEKVENENIPPIIAMCSLMGLIQEREIIQFYRKICQLEESTGIEMYTRWRSKIEDVVEGNTEVLLGEEDLKMLFEEIKSDETVTFEKLREPIRRITENTRDGYFELENGNTGLADILPKIVKVQLDPYNPHRFSLSLRFEDESGEDMNVVMEIDVKKQKFEWNSLVNPNLAQDEMRKCMSLTYDVLDRIASDLEEEVVEEKVTAQRPVQLQEKVEKKRPVPPAPKEKKEKQMPLTPTRLALLEQHEEVKRQREIKIEIPEEFEEIPGWEDLSYQDRTIVAQALVKDNELGMGKMKKLKKDVDGVPTFSKRINTTVPGGVRVLVRAVPQDNGTTIYKMFKIGYRGKIYKKNGI